MICKDLQWVYVFLSRNIYYISYMFFNRNKQKISGRFHLMARHKKPVFSSCFYKEKTGFLCLASYGIADDITLP